jgi:hypothetical protein
MLDVTKLNVSLRVDNFLSFFFFFKQVSQNHGENMAEFT